MDSSRLVRVARWVLLGLAAAGAVTSVVITRAPGPGGGAAADAAAWRCPMHPEAKAGGPAACPICGMALQPPAQPRVGAPAGAAAPPPALRPYDVGTALPRIFSQELSAPAWVADDGDVMALLHADDAAALKPGEPAWFAPTAEPAERVELQAAGDRPEAWDASLARVRFARAAAPAAASARAGGAKGGALPPASGGPRAGQPGWVTLEARQRRALVVPEEAVLWSPRGPYVLVASADGQSFARRSIAVGKTFLGMTTVLSGLAELERVAAAGAFFLDAEQRQQAGPSPTPAGTP